MQDPQSLKTAAALINSTLYSKGYFHDSHDDLNNLRFTTIDEVTDSYANDKLVINTLYQLLQEIDKSQNERIKLGKELEKKEDQIVSLSETIRGLAQEKTVLLNTNKTISNKYDVLEQHYEDLKKQNALELKAVSQERNLNRAMRKKFAHDMKRKDVKITTLTNRLVTSTTRIKNQGVDHAESQNLILSNKVESLSNDLDKATMLLNFSASYSELLANNRKNTPSTPRFYLEHYEPRVLVNPKGLVPLDDVEIPLLAGFDKLYDAMTVSGGEVADDFTEMSGCDEKIKALESQVERLQENLEEALRTSEKWKEREANRRIDGGKR